MKSCWPASGNNRSGFTPWRLTVYMWAYVNNSPVVGSERIQYTTFAHTVVWELYKACVCYRIIPQNCTRTRIWFFISDFHHKALLKQKQSWKHNKLVEKCFTLEEIIAEQGRARIFETFSITMTELPDFFFFLQTNTLFELIVIISAFQRLFAIGWLADYLRMLDSCLSTSHQCPCFCRA